MSPEELVDEFAAAARTSTVMYLAATADAVRRALFHDDHIYRYEIFAGVAFRICSEELYQQDWPTIRAEFVARSSRHKALVDDIEFALSATADFFKQATADSRAQRMAGAEPAASDGPPEDGRV